MKFSRYYIPAVGEMLNLKSNEEYEEAFREVYKNAVKARLRTHHQVGAHLSGGLDSGSVVSFAARGFMD
ncbi:asparagine synthase-related protein [Bacillus toyonensis]